MHVCIYIYREREREKDTQTNRQTAREKKKLESDKRGKCDRECESSLSLPLFSFPLFPSSPTFLIISTLPPSVFFICPLFISLCLPQSLHLVHSLHLSHSSISLSLFSLSLSLSLSLCLCLCLSLLSHVIIFSVNFVFISFSFSLSHTLTLFYLPLPLHPSLSLLQVPCILPPSIPLNSFSNSLYTSPLSIPLLPSPFCSLHFVSLVVSPSISSMHCILPIFLQVN